MRFNDCPSVEILFCKFTNEAKARVPTLSFMEQAHIFAIRKQKDKKSEIIPLKNSKMKREVRHLLPFFSCQPGAKSGDGLILRLKDTDGKREKKIVGRMSRLSQPFRYILRWHFRR